MRQVLTVALVLLADQLSKRWAITALSDLPSRTMPAVPGVIRFHLMYNTGAAFSLFHSAGAVAVLLSAVLVAVLLYLLCFRKDLLPFSRTGLLLALGGGIGNLVDRIVQGGRVTDFIEPLFVRFAVFNLADVAIVLGAALTILSLFKDQAEKDA